MTWNEWQDRVQGKTEQLLTWRKRRKLKRKEKQKRKNQIVDWIEALLWAALFVLLLNQYFLQAYAIPSGSMLDTIQLEDRMFVDKLVYGPEILPGIGKLPGLAEPKRGEIIIFENPKYEDEKEGMGRKVGAFEQLLHRLVYMLTFSLVNMDVKPNGEIAHHFLVKRLIGMPGDRIRQVNGKMEIMPAAENTWKTEETLIAEPLKRTYIKKTIPYNLYPQFYTYLQGAIEKSRGLPADHFYTESKQEIIKAGIAVDSRDFVAFKDEDYEMVSIQSAIYYKLQPYNNRIRSLWMRFDLGFYIADDRFFPMGDNRDNSHDARYFNPVLLSKVLGRAAFRFWPLQRIGSVE